MHVAFRRKYQAYKHEIDKLNAYRLASSQLKLWGLQHCVERSTLKAQVTLRVFDELVEKEYGQTLTIENVAEVSREMVNKWMESRLPLDGDNVAMRVKLALSE